MYDNIAQNGARSFFLNSCNSFNRLPSDRMQYSVQLLSILCVVAALNVASSQIVVKNDDYCDTSDGSDEPYTSACSHLSVVTFSCASNGRSGISNVTLTASRVNDGEFYC